MRRFLWHLVRFLSLPAVWFLLGEAVLQWSGELWSLDRVFAYQRAHPDSLYLRATDQVFYAYKYRGILTTRPAVVVTGSSRTMKFRAEMFGDRANSFYNAGGMLNSLDDVHEFCLTLPSTRTPAVLLLGLDLWWFNDQVEPTHSFLAETPKDTSAFDAHVIAMRWLLMHPRSFAVEALSMVRGSRDRTVGVAAREKGGGFRPDGSFKSAVPTPRSELDWRFVDREKPPIIERVKNAKANFPPADHVSPSRAALLDAVLERYEHQRVLVIGYLPPFSSEVLAQLQSDPRHARIWADFRRTMPEIFRKHRFPLLDASDTAALGMDDRAMSDGFHAEETFQVHVLDALLRDERVRAALPGARAVLERALASPRTNYWEPDFGS